MFLDASAIVAILSGEPDAPDLAGRRALVRREAAAAVPWFAAGFGV